MRFLIAGLGSIGRRHLANLLALGEQDIVLYRSHHSTMRDDRLPGGRSLSEFPVETDLQAALKSGVDAVIVSNPTALHLDVAIPAAEAGCHLLIEKPLSHSFEGVDRLEKMVERSGSRVLAGFQFRFHPGLQQVRRLLDEGAAGRPLSVRAHWGEYLPGWHTWEDYRQGYSARQDLGGGVILTLSHPLDYIRWLLGEVRELWAFTGEPGDLELQGVEGLAEIGLRFANEAIGSVHMDYNQRPPAHFLEIVGSEGMIHWDNASGEVRYYSCRSDQWQSIPAPQGFERNAMFLAEMRHFIRVAGGEDEPVCSLSDGRKALQIALAARESARDGRLVRLES
ncbi:MAG: Gfo/Idh/MocA family protein [Omnitrophica WOR_2 bacterium]